MEINTKVHEPEEMADLFSRLIGKPVGEAFGLFPPFYTDFGKNITIGDHVFINADCKFQDQGGITIEDGALIGHGVMLATLNHDFDPAKRYQSAMELLEALESWKPGGKTAVKESQSSLTMKSILGEGSVMDEAKGREMAKDARRLARDGQLGSAADKMEEAFNQCPSLRSKYADQVRLWRMGIAM